MLAKALAAAALAATAVSFAGGPATALDAAAPTKWVAHGSYLFEVECAAAGQAQPKQFTCTREIVEGEYRWVLWFWEPGIEV